MCGKLICANTFYTDVIVVTHSVGVTLYTDRAQVYTKPKKTPYWRFFRLLKEKSNL
jgi:hypothetical protein